MTDPFPHARRGDRVTATAEDITLTVQTPQVVAVARALEVRCGDSYVTLRQVMSRSDDEWTVYEQDGRQKGVVGKVDNAPIAATSEELLPWAADLVTRRERARLARRALSQAVDDAPHPVQAAE